MRRSGLFVVSGLLLAAAAARGGSRVPQGVSPGGSRVVSLIEARCPTFSWSGVEKARGYELVVFEVDEAVLEATEVADGAEGVPLFRVSVPGTAVSWTPSMDRCLASGGHYVWFVRAVGVGDGKWSEAKVFEVDSRPSVAEVEEALRVLRRYAEAEEAGSEAGPGTVEDPLRDQPDRRRSIAAEKNSSRGSSKAAAAAPGKLRIRGQPSGSEGRRLEPRSELVWPLFPGLEPITAEAAAPTLGMASLTVDEQVHLAPASSVFKDDTLFLWSDADKNTALGSGALSSNTIGTHSTALGFGALEANTGHADYGSYNTAVGSKALSANTTGDRNVAVGSYALHDNTTGYYNTAAGYGALRYNTTGYHNTAIGQRALRTNTSEDDNTATGWWALSNNSGGYRNTAVGSRALFANTTGYNNTAIGFKALTDNTTGYANTAIGNRALENNESGYYNTAVGSHVLYSNVGGRFNTASGFDALSSNISGSANVAVGHFALTFNTTGSTNTAVGAGALFYSTGQGNVALGFEAGYYATTGGSNVFVANRGSAGDSATIRIGTSGTHSKTFIAGIRGVTTGVADAIPVMVDSNGQLGTVSSSRRFKEDIRDMGETSSKLLDLRPVAFRYKQDLPSSEEAERSVRYGLIAEEVAEVFPELVVYSSDGEPETVLYHFLSSMLLNELQKQRRELEEVKRWLVQPEIAALCGGAED